MPRKKKITQSAQGPFIHGADPFTDFRNTLWYVWKALGLPNPTPMQYDLAHYLQSGPKRKVIEGYRGIGKSWILSAFVPHGLRLDPSLNYLIVSGNADRANAFSTFVLRLMQEIDIFKHLKPGEDAQRHSMVAFDINGAPPSHAPSVKSAGITGQITGSRANHIIADDVETPNNSGTIQQREKLSEQVKELDAIVKPGPECTVTFLGTPQTESTLYNVLGARGYEIRRYPSEYPTPSRLVSYGGTLDPRLEAEVRADPKLAGKPTDPLRFGELELAERKLSYGRSGYALQYLLDTKMSDAERYPLRLADLIVTDLDTDMGPEKVIWSNAPEYSYGNELASNGLDGDRFFRPAHIVGQPVPYRGSACAIDPSGRGKDELGYAFAKNINGQLFVPDFGGLRGGYTDENLIKLAHKFKEHKVKIVVVEENFSDGMFSKMLGAVCEKIYPVTIEEIKHSRQKELRIIDTLEPVMNQHKLIFDRAAVLREMNEVNYDEDEDRRKVYNLFFQMTRITKERGSLLHDDRLDALAMVVKYWLDEMGLDIDRKIVEAQNDRAAQRLRSYEESLGRRTPSGLYLPPHLSHTVGRRARSGM